jgi:hypothetical protein
LVDGQATQSLSDDYSSVALVWSADQWLRLLVGATGGSGGASTSASYLTVTAESSLTNERVLTAGTGLKSADSGANAAFTLSIDDGVVMTLTSSAFTGSVLGSLTGSVLATGGLSGSLQNLSNGLSYLVAGANITITSQSNGQVVISSTASGSSGPGLPRLDNLTILAGSQVVDQAVFQAISAFEFNPTGPETMAPSGSTTYVAYFQPIVEVFPTGVTLETQLFNVGLNSYVASSLLSCSALAATRLRSANLSGSLITGSNVYEMHMRITNARAGKAICKGAKLLVNWS